MRWDFAVQTGVAANGKRRLILDIDLDEPADIEDATLGAVLADNAITIHSMVLRQAHGEAADLEGLEFIQILVLALLSNWQEMLEKKESPTSDRK